jgi:hypothetical protein
MAKVAANTNPYAAREEITDGPPVYALPSGGNYAAPSPDAENGIMDSPIGAYSPSLRSQPGDTPDPMRTGHLRVRDMRPNPQGAPETHYRVLDADDRERHSVEYQDADGFEEFKGGSGKPAARNPRETPPAEPRPTSRLAPRTYSFTRPFFGGPMRLNGEHFSMADHRREYPILGTQPVKEWRNTYRVAPAPADMDMVDVAPNNPRDVPSARIVSVEVPLSRGWRL